MGKIKWESPQLGVGKLMGRHALDVDPFDVFEEEAGSLELSRQTLRLACFANILLVGRQGTHRYCFRRQYNSAEPDQ